MGDELIPRLVGRQWCQEFAQWEWPWTRERRVATPMPLVPAICFPFTCSTRTRQDTPCQRCDVHHGPSGRCRLYDGHSTGPETAEGKQRAALNRLRPKQKRTPWRGRKLHAYKKGRHDTLLHIS